jgi:hypothetical protein
MKKKKLMPKAVAAKQQPPKPNPFELKGSKRKFDVLGKRDKDGKKNIIRQREEAVEKVENTLQAVCTEHLPVLLLPAACSAAAAAAAVAA